MAGSWRHMTTSKGRLRNSETFCGRIENGGDAYEAAEECYGMIWWLARTVAGLREDDFGGPERTRDGMLDIIAEAEANYRDGLKLGGVQRDR